MVLVYESIFLEDTNSDPQLKPLEYPRRNKVKGKNVGGCWAGSWGKLKGTTSGLYPEGRP